jgi:hypothetical protein
VTATSAQRTKETGSQTSVDQTGGPWTTIDFDTTKHLVGGVTVPSLSAIRVTNAGYYLVSYFISMDHSDGANSDCIVTIRTTVGGVVRTQGYGHCGQSSTTGRNGVGRQFIIHANALDDIELQYRFSQNNGELAATPLQDIGGEPVTTGDPPGPAISSFSVLKVDDIVPPLLVGKLTSNMVIPDTNWLTITGWSSVYNKLFPTSISSGSITIPETGRYLIGVWAPLDEVTLTSYRDRPQYCRVLKGGSYLPGSSISSSCNNSSGLDCAGGSFLADLALGDVLQFQYQTPAAAPATIELGGSTVVYRERVTTFYILKVDKIGEIYSIADDLNLANAGQFQLLPTGWSETHTDTGYEPHTVNWYISQRRSGYGGLENSLAYNCQLWDSFVTHPVPAVNSGYIDTPTFNIPSGYNSYRLRGDVFLEGEANAFVDQCSISLMSSSRRSVVSFSKVTLGGMSPTGAWQQFDLLLPRVANLTGAYLRFDFNTIDSRANNYRGARFANVRIVGVLT